MRRLMIESQDAVLAITSRKAKLNIKRVQPKMNMQTTPPELKIDHTNPSFRVDWAQVRRNQGQYSLADLASNLNAENMRNSQRSIQKIAAAGDRMMQIYNPANPIAELAVENMKNEIPSLNVRSEPIPMPDVEWDVGGVEIQYLPGSSDIQWDVPKLEFEVEPFDVIIQLSQYPKVTITADSDWAHRWVGKRLDMLV